MKKTALFLISVFTVSIGYSQMNFQLRTETGYMKYQYNTVQVDAGPDWKGYYIDNKNGFDLSIINGFTYCDKIFAGIGTGYLNFKGINGFMVFTDFEYLPFKTKLRPVANLKFGYNHIWNQYENGTGSALGELDFGLNYILTEKIDVYLLSGFLMTQQSLFIPIRLGLKF